MLRGEGLYRQLSPAIGIAFEQLTASLWASPHACRRDDHFRNEPLGDDRIECPLLCGHIRVGQVIKGLFDCAGRDSEICEPERVL